MGLVVALVLLGVTLAAAIVRPAGAGEAVVAVPAAALCILGPLSVDSARDEIGALAPTLGLVARGEGENPRLGAFTVHGLVTVPVALGGATLAPWASLHLIGA